MCLWTIYHGKIKAKKMARLPETVVCWKVVRRRRITNHYFPEYYYKKSNYNFQHGWNITKPLHLGEGYPIAFHAFLNKDDAMGWQNSYLTPVVKCKTRKVDIVALGCQGFAKKCLVTKRIWIPRPRTKTA